MNTRELDERMTYIREVAGTLEDSPEAFAAETRYDFNIFRKEMFKEIKSQRASLFNMQLSIYWLIAVVILIVIF